ncbi:MAG: hypothetical protein ACOVP1_00680 [Bacteroidia bacterium]
MKLQLFCCFLLLSLPGFTQGFYSDTSSLTYARSLYDNKEYEWCEEVLREHIGNSKNDSIYLLYAKTLFASKQYSGILQLKPYANKTFPQTKLYYQALSIYLDSFEYIDNLIELNPLLKAYLYLKEGDIISVQELQKQYVLEDSLYLNEQIQLLSSRKKSSRLPIYSSLLIPGSGKYLLGVKKDGLISFLSFATYGFLAIRAFDRYGISSSFAWVNTALTFGFYGANVLGTQSEIKRQKLYQEKILKKSVNEKLENYMFSLAH